MGYQRHSVNEAEDKHLFLEYAKEFACFQHWVNCLEVMFLDYYYKRCPVSEVMSESQQQNELRKCPIL